MAALYPLFEYHNLFNQFHRVKILRLLVIYATFYQSAIEVYMNTNFPTLLWY